MKRLATSLTALSMLLAMGCTEQQPAANTEALPQGLSVLQADDTHLSMAYKQGDTVIYLEALRGQRTADMYQQDPQAPRYEVDARFVSDDGNIFYSQRGGDNWLEPKWAEQLERRNALAPTRESNERLFQLATAAAQAMDAQLRAELGAERAALLEPLARPLRGFGLTAASLYAEHKQRMLEHKRDDGVFPEGEVPGEVAYGDDKGGDCDDWVTFGSNYYYIAVHDGSTAVIARHSATRLYEWRGYWAQVHDSCNHGRCAYEMGQKCFLQYYEAREDYKPSWQMQSCGTDYHAFSNDGHNCHDDTRVQMANFVYGNGHQKGPGSKFWCYGDDSSDISSWPGDQSGSPDCDSSRDEGYNHYDMCRFVGTHSYNSAGGCYCDAACEDYNDCCVDGPW